jgi:BON domain-containing protein
MARYDEGFGQWRGRRGGAYDRGSGDFGDADELPEGARPRSFGGGEWNRQQQGGGPRRRPSFGPSGEWFGGGGGGGYGQPRGGFGRGGHVGGRGARGHDAGFSRGPVDNRRGWMAGSMSPPRGADWRGPRGGGDRGVYGGAYEEYGGYPGGPSRGEYYGGERPSQARGYDAGWSGEGRARRPFMPEEAYRRHPEYRQEPHRREWEAHQHEYGDEEMSDDQVRQAVYQRMHADAWLEPEKIEVQVEDGVVTLTGEVDDFLKARYAWDDAWEADGVRGVVNNITVRADEPRQEPHGDVVPQAAGDRTTPEEAGGMS